MLDTKVKTGEVRLSYAHIFEKFSFSEDQKKKFSVSLLIPKTDTDTIQALKNAYKNAIENGKEKFGAAFSKAEKNAPFVRVAGGNYGLLIDGDESDDVNAKGCYILPLKSDSAPGVLSTATGAKKWTKENGGADEVYSGCYAKVTLNVFGFNKPLAGISAGLNNILKTRDGERFGGAAPAEDDFAEELAEIEKNLDDLI